MSQKYFKPLKKYVSKNLAITKLKISAKQFDRLVVLSSIYPVLAAERNCIDKAQDRYYAIDDIKRIYFSDAYRTILKNKSFKSKKEKYEKLLRFDKAACFEQEEIGLVDLVKSKYSCFGDSLSDLFNSLRNLYFIQALGITKSTDGEQLEYETALQIWEEFVLKNGLIEKSFMDKKGIFFSFNIEKIRILWSIPYPAHDFSDIIEEKKDIEKIIKTSGIRFVDFDSSSSDDEISEDKIIDHNDSSKLDTSLLIYSSNLQATHVKLCVHKLNLIYGEMGLAIKNHIFENKKFNISVKSICKHLEFILKSQNAIISSVEDADIIITETVDTIYDDKIYVQPQFIFDSINKNVILDHKLYSPGKKLPVHISPFADVLEALDSRVLKTLSNTKKYKILDKVIEIN